MASIKQLIAAERKTREVIEQGGLPQPDEVEYAHTCIRLIWHESKTVMVVDVDEFPDPELEALDRLDDGLPPADEAALPPAGSPPSAA